MSKKKGENKGQVKYMGESLDIVKFVDEREGSPLLKPDTKRTDLEPWANSLSSAGNDLLKPRVRKIYKRDFATTADLEYHANKYKVNFDELFAKSGEFIKIVNEGLKQFEGLIKGDKTLNAGGLSYDDIKYLPVLRNITVVKGLTWPPKVKEYVEVNCNKGGLKIYFDQAI